MKCSRCHTIREPHELRKTSGNRLYCRYGCQAQRQPVTRRPHHRAPLDSYEAESEDEGVRMRTRGGYPSSY